MYQDSGIGYSPALVARKEQEAIMRRAIDAMEVADNMALTLMRARCVPRWARDIIKEAADEEGIHIGEVLGASRRKDATLARHRAMYLIKATKPGLSFPQIARWFDRDHTSTIYGVAKFGLRNGLPALTSSLGLR